jgi:hypothetical protein
MPYVPLYAMDVLRFLKTRLGDKVWGPYGPRDAVSLKDDWASPHILAVDQLPMVAMAENYRSGLLWRLFMAEPDIRAGLAKLGFRAPALPEGFPEAVVTVALRGGKYRPDAYAAIRHPDRGSYLIPYRSDKAGQAVFTLSEAEEPGQVGARVFQEEASVGPNLLSLDLPQGDGRLMRLEMAAPSGARHVLPLRLY